MANINLRRLRLGKEKKEEEEITAKI